MPDYNRDRDYPSFQRRSQQDDQQYGNKYNQMRNAGNYGSRRSNEMRAYGEVYHGNVEQRERDTNMAQGNRYYGNRYNTSGDYDPDLYRRNSDEGGYSGSAQRGGYGYRDDERGFGNAGNEFSSDYGGEEQRSRYGGDTRNYGNANQGGFDRDWWDRTKNNMSSWFGGQRNEEGPHRGKGPKGYQRSEQRIREDVCERLSDDPYIDASDIDIEIQNNEVILKGSVDSKEAKRRAEDITESVLGVNNVQNQLRVGQWNGAHTSGTIASDIERTTRNNQF